LNEDERLHQFSRCTSVSSSSRSGSLSKKKWWPMAQIQQPMTPKWCGWRIIDEGSGRRSLCEEASRALSYEL